MYYCLMYLFCWCLSEFHPSIDLSFAFLLPTTTFHVAGVGWSVQVHSLSGGLSKTSSAAWTNAYSKCSSPSLATLFLCLSLEFCRILRWPKSQFGWRRLRNLCILQLDYVFAYVTLIKYTYYYYAMEYYIRNRRLNLMSSFSPFVRNEILKFHVFEALFQTTHLTLILSFFNCPRSWTETALCIAWLFDMEWLLGQILPFPLIWAQTE